MKNVFSPEKIDVLILCGGEGKRLRGIIEDRPKPMAEIRGRPFLDILIDYIASQGFRRFILCAGYKGEIVRRYYKNKHGSLNILVLKESKLLGTAGAIKNAESIIKSNPFLVMNGDSFCSLDLHKFINFHKEKKASFSMVLVNTKANKDYGVVNIDSSRRIISFSEKIKAKKGVLINSGIYLFGKRIFSVIEAGKKLSLECDIFPRIVAEGFYGYVTKGRFIDIGTPDRYERAKGRFRLCHPKKLIY
ncbi:MAG: hypothetical protein AMJ78_06400 [Omnitrophica WOR_2 bacterium SM23_29]|nr:MAG: hypothetical protein AMJ78_06400 [Omnitrophica WOR_2 bacterium SM23_29]